MKPVLLVLLSLLVSGCVCPGNGYECANNRLSRVEIIKHSVAPHRVFTTREILELPDDLLTAELFEIFGRRVEARMEMAPFFVLSREGHANSTDEKFRYGFYVWPSKIVREYSDRVPIEFISWSPDGISFDASDDPSWIQSHVIIWPPRLAGQRHPGYIPAFEAQNK